ncbi:MAG: hypothetical protein A3K19_11230 [Lentisphaerae bacterium RIFOXYB12_FULL_65_16]|nr:MAG: hypothetical protein A3K18_25200 [Lentisphaerae bacterium RIFOXYA12_64_32]OGV90141.1 MAG: hypothetical protein A3K19_11230 [Lentisphaerae bacterium RIFOXYB12_FULL_65_16]
MTEGRPKPDVKAESVGQGVQALVRTFHVLFFLLRLLIVVILAYLVFSGVFYVREHEAAMLFRFGELTKTDGKDILTSGKYYWAWPYPIDRVERIPAQRSITLTTPAFWPTQNPNQLEAPKPNPEAEGQALRPGDGGYVVTGDANIMHMLWTVTYRVRDARRYYLGFFSDVAPSDAAMAQARKGPQRGAEAVIESVLANAVLQEVSAWSVEDVLVLSRGSVAEGQGREGLGHAVERRLRLLLDKLDVGIEVQQVSLTEPQPPLATQGAFREVVDAAQDYRMELDNAQAYEKRVITEAEGRSARILADAKAYRTRIVESVKAESAYFTKILDEYEKNPKTMLVALYTDVIRDVLRRVETKYVVHSRADGRQEIRLMLGAEPEKPPTPATPGEE